MVELPINHFKQAIKAGRIQIGLWSSLCNNYTVEILATAGFDWLLLDMEHSPNDIRDVFSQLQAAAGGPSHPVVRPPWNDAVVLKRLLDAGAQSFLIPYVQNADEARAAVAATRYPPKGMRGFSTGTRANRFGRVPDYYRQAEEELCVLVQVETGHALGNLEEIAAVDGVDGVFIGPGDLSADLGYLGQPSHPEMQVVIEQTIDRIKATGKAAGILTGDEQLARRCLEQGCVFTAVGADQAILARGSEQLAARFKALFPG